MRGPFMLRQWGLHYGDYVVTFKESADILHRGTYDECITWVNEQLATMGHARVEWATAQLGRVMRNSRNVEGRVTGWEPARRGNNGVRFILDHGRAWRSGSSSGDHLYAYRQFPKNLKG